MKKGIRILIVLLITITSSTLSAQVSDNWIYINGLNSLDSTGISEMIELSNGDLLCIKTGDSWLNNSSLIRLSSDGNVIWNKNYNPGFQFIDHWPGFTTDGIFEMPNGDIKIFLIGKNPPQTSFFVGNGAMLTVDFLGNPIDTVRYDSTTLTLGSSYFCDVMQLRNGNFVGILSSNQATSYPLMMELTPSGDTIRTTRLPFYRPHKILENQQGEIVVLGLNSNGGFQNGTFHMLTYDYSTFSLTSNKLSLFNTFICEDAIEAPNGNIIMVGDSGKVCILNALGDSINVVKNTYSANYAVWKDIAPFGNDEYLISGSETTWYWRAGKMIYGKIDASGQLKWVKEVQSPQSNYYGGVSTILKSQDNKIVIVGGGPFISLENSQTQNLTSQPNAFVIKMDTSGIFAADTICGNLILDLDLNCLNDPTDGVYNRGMVTSTHSNGRVSYGVPDQSGSYKIITYNKGSYDINYFPIDSLVVYSGCNGNPITVMLTDTINEKVSADILLNSQLTCALMSTHVSFGLLRRCNSGTLTVNSSNIGQTTSVNPYVEVTIDTILTPVSSTPPWNSVNGNTYTFLLDTLSPGANATVTVQFETSCGVNAGTVVCVKAHAYPDSICYTGTWNGANLMIEGSCVNDSVQFRLINSGNGNMTNPVPINIIEDNVMLVNGSEQLNLGEVVKYSFPGSGRPINFISQQPFGHPFPGYIGAFIDDCPLATGQNFATPLRYITGNTVSYIHEVCDEVIGSFDPNDKQVAPQGIGSEGYIFDDQRLDYTIRFQNTGNDTAFWVVLLDTLDDDLDITTLQINASSHNYTARIKGSRVLEFKYENILLPDSNVNELESHGFVNYSISPLPNLPEGTEITNGCGIYFDYNAVVNTNVTLNTITYDIASKLSVGIDEQLVPENLVNIYPNPTSGMLNIDFEVPVTETVSFDIYNLQGRLVNSYQLQAGQNLVITDLSLLKGLYLYQLKVGGQNYVMGKIIAD